MIELEYKHGNFIIELESDDIFDLVRQNYEPSEIFDMEVLVRWAKDQRFFKLALDESWEEGHEAGLRDQE